MVVELIGTHNFVGVLVAVEGLPFHVPHGAGCIDVFDPAFGQGHPFDVVVT